MLNFANAGLQAIATALIVFGGALIYESQEYVGGGILILAGLIAYVVYEKFPSTPAK